MRWHKKILSHCAVQSLLACWVKFYQDLVLHTTSWTFDVHPAVTALINEKKPVILACWHQRLLIDPLLWHRKSGRALDCMMISQHRDGVFMSRVSELQGTGVISGSSRRGGVAALKKSVAALKRGEVVGITPDGPGGPNRQAAPGVVQMARLSGAAIVPVSCATAHRKVFSSWDRFILPLPFGKGRVIWGEPLYVARNSDDGAQEAARLTVQTRLSGLCDQVDRSLNLPLNTAIVKTKAGPCG